MDINLNDNVLVKLTPYALTLMLENHFKLFKGAKYAPRFVAPEVDGEGFTRMQLWVLMSEFGSGMYSGNPNQCFEGNLIRVSCQDTQLHEENTRLNGEAKVMRDLLEEAVSIIETIDPESADEGEKLGTLCYSIQQALRGAQ